MATPERIMDSSPNEKLRDHFLGWQCRIRQIAMRQGEGRPSTGMRPRVLTRGGHEILEAMSVVLIPGAPEESTDFFRFQAQKTADPKQVYDKALQYLQATHFQRSKTFSDRMTALFMRGSAPANALLDAGECMLVFNQFSQTYRMFCTVTNLTPAAPAFDATYWHNRMFNPNIPGDIAILEFQPDWNSAQADPGP